MKTHYYKNLNNSDVAFSNKFESALYDVIPDETLLTEDLIVTLYDIKRASKPLEYPSMSKVSVIQHLRLLNDKKFVKSYAPFELRNSLKLGR
jgi:hypothetical protein